MPGSEMPGRKRIAVVGGGISGIAAANVLQQCGHHVTVFEKSGSIGGVWAVSYPEVRLQNSWHQYGFSGYPWPRPPDLHPTAKQIMDYLHEAVAAFKLDLRTGHEVVAMHETASGWNVDVRNDQGLESHAFDFVVIAIGQYTEGKHVPEFPGQSQFKGLVVTERDVKDLSIFKDRRVIIVGFGKSALDMTVLAVKHGAQVHHVFRTPRWTIPFKILGIHYTYPLFARIGSVMMTSWAHPTATERFLHRQLQFVVGAFWKMLQAIFRRQILAKGRGLGPEARQRLDAVIPDHPIVLDWRSATALAPFTYYRDVAEGRITPHHGEVLGFDERGLRLSGKEEHVEADIVVLSVGSKTPEFPFMPEQYRALLESENDGVQLYRHVIHPRIPNLGFAGFNHGFMHIPSAELGAVWLAAYLDGYLELPSVEEMEASIRHVQNWKRTHVGFEPSRAVAVSTRYQQYNDIILKDLRLSAYRKAPNVLAEIFMRYGPTDYRDVLDEYRRKLSRGESFRPLPVNT